MKILTVSDKEVSLIYGSKIKDLFKDVDLAVSCGDLSYYYLEYIISSLDIPLYYVRGNHAREVEYGCAGPRKEPWGAIDIHKKVVRDPDSGLLMAGIEGSLIYNYGNHQYTQNEMWAMALQLVPGLLLNKIRYGRYLDLFVTHAPPWGIHDADDIAHQGVKAFNWLIKTFKPAYHVHGHIHVYNPQMITETVLGDTLILNTYGYRKLSLDGELQLQTDP
jgi:Icc-related predicted phosphoesterase